jgi:uncharacterized protein YvpB
MITLNVPYASQLDNKYNPYGTCNITSVAMCLRYFGIVGDGSESQLEDQLYDKCDQLGLDRHDPYELKKLIETFYGKRVQDDFKPNGTLEDIKVALNKDQPCIVHGYFTRSGHVIVIKGYDEKGFIVNDPYGEYYATGYDTSVSGEGLHYSYDLIAGVCSPESKYNPTDIWLHRIRKV